MENFTTSFVAREREEEERGRKGRRKEGEEGERKEKIEREKQKEIIRDRVKNSSTDTNHMRVDANLAHACSRCGYVLRTKKRVDAQSVKVRIIYCVLE